MSVSLDVALSAQMALMKRMETIAHNVANANTAGFRAEEVSFSSLISNNTLTPTAFSSEGDSHIMRDSGALKLTGNPLDVAVSGDAWFGISTPGGTVYTRDGRFKISPTGALQTLNGHSVLDVGGAPIQLDASAGEPRIAADGMITQGNRQAGALGLFQIAPEAELKRYENSGVIPNRAAQPLLDFTSVRVQQGYVEGSNVNPVLQMTKLIAVSRSFEAVSNAIRDSERRMDNAIRTLGSTQS